MTLFLIIISIVIFALTSNFFKNKKVFIALLIVAVLFCYFLLAKNFFYPETFLPSSKINTYYFCCNYYNLVTNAIKNKKLYITTSKFYPKLETDNIYKNYPELFFADEKYQSLFDTSYYKGKVYLYFGITPILLFYLPFNLITNLYLTDKFLVFILSCFIFLLSLFLIKNFIKDFNFNNKPPSVITILTVFLIGLCNYLPFLLIRNNIYEVLITTANLLLILSFLFFYFYLKTKNNKKQYILILLISLCLALSVGARPYYVLHIPAFFILITFLKYNQTKNIKELIKTAITFLIPCLLYGTVVALYNYLRFDSIFEFGFKYTLNSENHYEQFTSLKDVFLAIKYDLFQFPEINKNTFFSLVQTKGHLFGNEFVAGIIWTFPLIFLFVLIPKFLIDTFKQNKNIFYITILMVFVICINLFITSFIGMVTRYFFEWMFFIVILSIILFYYLYDKAKTKNLKNILNIFFVLIFCYSVFINVCLLFCENNAMLFAKTNPENYIQAINFLFK
ncbi:hypothetical protein [Candidatus Ruminimicrobium bovinum]|uniref:hypothetical protein n=1 Tax=Candidatus Ruminimicrobium bovinum TaxID=3242779 RepID=UPI0039B9A348